jgi:arylsulfatase A-like enzyme
MHPSSILVVVVDGLRASALGAYGNTTYSTPALDHFATKSLLFDECYSDSVDAMAIYRALWYSQHPARPVFEISGNSDVGSPRSIASIFAEMGFQTELITDDTQLIEVSGAGDFQECEVVALESSRAADLACTNLGLFFAALAERINIDRSGSHASRSHRSNAPRLIWAHSRGGYGPWDAPFGVQESLLDGESSVVRTAPAPDSVSMDNGDPDIAFRYGAAYGAQVLALDVGWQLLIDTIDSMEQAEEWCIVFLGGRGFPLGEHGIIGGFDRTLPIEQLHVPCMIRFADGRGKLARSTSLMSHLDILPTLLELAGVSNERGQSMDGRSQAFGADAFASHPREWLLATTGDGPIAIRTTNWCLRETISAGRGSNNVATEPMLFVRPDDRWEANDVSKLCPDIVEELEQLAGAAAASFVVR